MCVYTLVGTKPDERPKGTCPGCGCGTVWKIGEKLTPHVAHEADAHCGEPGVSVSETAEHMNAKMHLATLLRSVSSVRIVTRCRVGHEHRKEWEVPRWDSVAVEYTIGSTRPDIVLLSHGRESAAVEIMHSHAVDAAKSRKLAALGIPWIEVDATFALAWTGQGAIRVRAADATTTPMGCAKCDEIEAEREARRARAAQLAREMQAQQDAARAEIEAHDQARRLHWANVELEAQRRWQADAAQRAAEREARLERERVAEAEREAARRFDFAASRAYWDRVFAEPWAQEILRDARGGR